MDINLIVAIGKDGAIGKNGDLIWRLPSDLRHFKRLTTGHPVIMGRKTWESLPKKPLPSRQNIVMTRSLDFSPTGAEVAHTADEALNLANDSSPFIIGGSEIYKTFLPMTGYLYLTEVDAICLDADTFLTLDLEKDWEKIEESEPEESNDGIRYKFVKYRRR